MRQAVTHEINRPCPVCGVSESTLFSEERIDPTRLNALSYASRKEPEGMTHCLRLCHACDLVYAPSTPLPGSLMECYKNADYDSSTEATFAALTYMTLLAPHLGNPQGKTALDVGAGNGALLPLLRDAGFSNVMGLEPSLSAIAGARGDVVPMLRAEPCSPGLLMELKPDLVCCFMLLEHVADPLELIEMVCGGLRPGGLLAIVVHNWRGRLNRILRMRSPIIDIEHLQLFSPRSLRRLLENGRGDIVELRSYWNTYPLSYWLRMAALLPGVGRVLPPLAKFLRISQVSLPFPVGNLFAIYRKRM